MVTNRVRHGRAKRVQKFYGEFCTRVYECVMWIGFELCKKNYRKLFQTVIKLIIINLLLVLLIWARQLFCYKTYISNFPWHQYISFSVVKYVNAKFHLQTSLSKACTKYYSTLISHFGFCEYVWFSMNRHLRSLTDKCVYIL